MARVLGIGIATLDIINFVDHYPAEDEELRAYDQQIRRGGNVTNTLVVLSQLQHQCAWAGVLAQDVDGRVIADDLRRHGIDMTHCRRVADGRTPVSYITVNGRNGSRSIVHYRDLPELEHPDLAQINAHEFDWVHFEGRNISATRRTLDELIRGGVPAERLSVEIEKPRQGIEALFRGPGVLVFSRAFARARGFDSAEQVLQWARSQAPSADLLCTWGDQGAWCLPRDGELIHEPAVPVARVIDTVGAGDTFVAGMIHARLHASPWPAALAAANGLAARKCAQFGFADLGVESR